MIVERVRVCQVTALKLDLQINVGFEPLLHTISILKILVRLFLIILAYEHIQFQQKSGGILILAKL